MNSNKKLKKNNIAQSQAGFIGFMFIVLLAAVAVLYIAKDESGQNYLSKIVDGAKDKKKYVEQQVQHTQDVMKERDKQIQAEINKK
jgi:hypothetical protein